VSAGKISQTPMGVGREWTKNFNPRRTLVATETPVEFHIWNLNWPPPLMWQ